MADFGPAPGSSSSRRLPRVLRLLYTHNPFYLLSVGFVLHGTGLWMQSSATAYDPWPLMGLTCAHILMMALTAQLIVRLGGVWDDARSILLIILFLFVELSLTFDDPLVTDRRTGTALILAGLTFAVLITEDLLFGLRIRLPVLFRLPLHALLGLMFLYPLWLVSAATEPAGLSVQWRIYLFSPVAGALLLTLLPAIRRGAEYVRDNGTPWGWPWFPWTVFVLLGAGLGVRGYALSLSFDPVLSLRLSDAMALQTAWGLYFLVPLLLAIAFLLLEIGLVSRNQIVQHLALFLPAMGIGLSLPSLDASVPYAEFLAQFLREIASPVFVSVVAAAGFYGVAFLRGVRLAELGLVATLLAASVVGPETISADSLVTPQPLPLFAVCVVEVFVGMRRWQSQRTLLGLFCGVAALGVGPLAEWPQPHLTVMLLHLAGVVIFGVGLVFSDRLAKILRQITAVLLLAACVVALASPQPLLENFRTAYILAVIGMTFLCAYGLRNVLYFTVGLLSTAAVAVNVSWHVYRYLKQFPEWRGIGSFLIAFALLALAVTISATKAGLTRRLVFLVPVAKGGPPRH